MSGYVSYYIFDATCTIYMSILQASIKNEKILFMYAEVVVGTMSMVAAM